MRNLIKLFISTLLLLHQSRNSIRRKTSTSN